MNTRSLPGSPDGGSSNAVRVTVLDGPDKGLVATLELARVIVGRGETADVRLTDETVSEFHLEVRPLGRLISFFDKQSKNGTRVHGVQIDSGRALSGSVFDIGLSRLMVELVGEYTIPKEDVREFGSLIGESSAMRAMYARLTRFASVERPLLLHGETGTGKELIVREVHLRSPRRKGPLVIVDCGSLHGSVAASELFGHVRGAFTDARHDQRGLFDQANGGTIFLDEIGDLPLELQPLLLRVLQEKEVRPVGAKNYHKVDVRVVAATWRDLMELVNQGKFRSDLYYRLHHGCVAVPSLEERREDIPLLIRNFLAASAKEWGGPDSISDEACQILSQRQYPGNVRELKNTIETLALEAVGPVIAARDLRAQRWSSQRLNVTLSEESEHVVRSQTADARVLRIKPFKEAKEEFLQLGIVEYLKLLIAETSSIAEAARVAKIQRNTLKTLLDKYGIKRNKTK